MLRNLQVLWLCDNPCAEDEKEYRYKVVRYLPWIKKLDHHDITDEEVLASMNSTSATMPPKIRNRLTSTSKPLAEPLSTFSQINLFNNSQSSEKVNNVSKMSSPISPVDFIIKKDRFPSAKVDDNMAVNGNGKTANQNSSSNNGQKKSIKSSRTKQAVPLGAINGNPNLSPSKMNNVMAGNKSPVNKTRSSVVSLMTPSRTISPNILSSVPKSYKSVNNSEEHSEMVLTLEGETEAISREKVKQNNEFDEPWQSNVLIAVLGLLDELNKTELQTVQRKLQLLILNQQRTLLGKVKESEIK
ncbi:hypothetical protein G9A89_018586 [Geosiphon pyriformis]|nr:hypothetical protein G9A89_018586 [Geosiphon pyriformis]